ncbi:activating signal cointegrator 1 complex subunit 1-like [Eurosta solidaginis]|uniref:activating signal cointegrator 1 complex subunit 1-like n=1 Tax=Eurosta solidaginis TaxID=178769 RepID=UPI0035316855
MSANAYMEEKDNDEHEDFNDYILEELPNSYKLTMHVAQRFYGGLFGSKGTTKKRIESETWTNISVPSNKDSELNLVEDVSINGKTRSAVLAARRKINLLIFSLRKRTRPTHFTCVPLNYGEVRERYCDLKKEILSLNLPGIEENLFQHEACLHINLFICVLLDNTERTKGGEILQSCQTLLEGLRTPFEIGVSCLEIKNDNPAAVRVLYARVESPELQKFADLALKQFLRSGLGYDDYERDAVKLHMTIMSRGYRRKLDAKAASSFDAREILKRFGDYNFGKVTCSEVHLCAMNAGIVDKGTFYEITASLKF